MKQTLRIVRITTIVIFLCFTDDLSAQKRPDAGDPLLPAFATEKATGDLPKIRQRKTLRALVTHSRTDFFLINNKPHGLFLEFLQHYEKHLNAGIKREEQKTRIVFVPVTFDQLIPSLLEGKGDLAAALLTATPEREKKVAFATNPKLRVNELVVSHNSVEDLKSLEDLSGKRMHVLRGSSYAEHLRGLNKRFAAQNLKPILIEEADSHMLTEDILELVNAGVVKLTVADDFKARLWARVLPSIVVHENLKVAEDNVVGTAIRKDNPELKKDFEKFMEKASIGTLLGNVLFRRYYKDVRWIKNPIGEKERKKLEQYIELFRKYGQQYGFDYLAVAAQAYQESGLNHDKKSPRGAIGLMQLLPSTAADPNVGIPDIEDVENNVRAGVKYLVFLRDRYFSDPVLAPEDRFAFTWAAYNAGPAKVRRMRKLAGEMGLDTNQWFQNVELAAGRIVGRETVKYVANIYKYYVAYSLVKDLLEKKGGSQAIARRTSISDMLPAILIPTGPLGLIIWLICGVLIIILFRFIFSKKKGTG
jgi:membrane-bound lytic murein transglycosylase MltF